MQFRGVSRLQRVALSAIPQKYNCHCPAVLNLKPLKSQSAPVPLRHFHTTLSVHKELRVHYTSNLDNIGFLHKLLLKLGLKNSRLIALSYLTYEALVDRNIDYDVFYKELNMPDTMLSWFLITELHVWMIMVRYMAQGDDGVLLRNALSKAMWEDVVLRFDKLGRIKRKIKKQQLTELNAQFNAAIVSYDEGILGDDKALANALWRRMMQSNPNDAVCLEKLVMFVRKQIQLLDSIPTSELLSHPRLKWIDYKTVNSF